MLTHEQASKLAAWANTHDGGVPQPRAEVIPLSTPNQFAVNIRSLSVVSTGDGRRWTQIDTDTAFSQSGAARILGY